MMLPTAGVTPGIFTIPHTGKIIYPVLVCQTLRGTWFTMGMGKQIWRSFDPLKEPGIC